MRPVFATGNFVGMLIEERLAVGSSDGKGVVQARMVMSLCRCSTRTDMG